MTILIWFLCMLPYIVAQSDAICSLKTCHLPDCWCATKSKHELIPLKKIPQIVLFTFDDDVDDQVYAYYQRLFTPSRKNPNGCPVSVTFFVRDNKTVYSNVKNLYLAGHEIGSHTITHRLPKSWWSHASYSDLKKEFTGQRRRLSKKASIPLSEIRGVRTPYLEVGGDVQFRMMKDTGFQYDATFMTGPTKNGRSWPYTLDYPVRREFCNNPNCPKKSHPGIWEVPLNEWKGLSGEEWSMADGCSDTMKSKADVLRFLWQNFNASYNGNREPFGINMHARWFNDEPGRLDAMDTFIDEILSMQDVYMVTVNQAIEWMRNPQRIRDVKDFSPWKTSC